MNDNDDVICGPARDTVLSNRQTGKLNFDANYITMRVSYGSIQLKRAW